MYTTAIYTNISCKVFAIIVAICIAVMGLFESSASVFDAFFALFLTEDTKLIAHSVLFGGGIILSTAFSSATMMPMRNFSNNITLLNFSTKRKNYLFVIYFVRYVSFNGKYTKTQKKKKIDINRHCKINHIVHLLITTPTDYDS